MNLAGPRVALRQWIERDIDSFVALNADRDVMEFFPRALTADESVEMFAGLHRHISDHGWGLWAVEINNEMAGFTGLARPGFEAGFTPCIEIGWRFHRRFWGRGHALEAARLALRFSFENLKVHEIVSFTACVNLRSQRLMQRLGMKYVDRFEHPRVPEGHPLRTHVLYRIQNTPEVRDRLNQGLDLSKLVRI